MKNRLSIILIMLAGCLSFVHADDVPVRVTGYEYWIDHDYSNRVSVDTVGHDYSSIETGFSVDLSQLSEGVHSLSVWSHNSNNQWSKIETRLFYVVRNTPEQESPITAYRYVFNNGMSNTVELQSPVEQIDGKIVVPVPNLKDMDLVKKESKFIFDNKAKMVRDLSYSLAMQFKSEAGQWSGLTWHSFNKTDSLEKEYNYLVPEKPTYMTAPLKGDFEPVEITLGSSSNYELKASVGANMIWYKKGKDGYVEILEIPAYQMKEGYREFFDEGKYYGIVYGGEVNGNMEMTLTPVCPTPEIVRNGNTITIGMLDAPGEPTYYYTTDGTVPTTGSNVYTAPFEVNENMVVKAIAVIDNYAYSDMAVLTVSDFAEEEEPEAPSQVDTPVASFDEASGLLTLTCSTPNTIIYYKVTGDAEKEYTEPLQLKDNREVTFYAMLKDDYLKSDTQSFAPATFKCNMPRMEFNGREITVYCDQSDIVRWDYYREGVYDYSGYCYNGNTNCCFLLPGKFVAVSQNQYKLDSDTLVFELESGCASIWDYTYVSKPGTLHKAYEWMKDNPDLKMQMFAFKGTLNHDDLAYIRDSLSYMEYIDLSQVTIEEQTLPDSIFANTDILYFRSPANLKSAGSGLFAGCKNLGAIEWNSNIDVPDDILGNQNYPNLLLYVNSAVYANGKKFKNVVANGVASNITLKDTTAYGNFCCKFRSFNARRISYTRHFGQETLIGGESSGWEAISLPFTVSEIRHETNGLLGSFAKTDLGDKKPFWLYWLKEEGFTPTDNMSRSYPYIIAMPNNPEYSDEYILSGTVTFTGKDVYVGDDTWGDSNDKYKFMTNYVYLDADTTRSVLNSYEEYDGHRPGSIFIPGLRGVKPFEPYLTAWTQNNSIQRGPVYALDFNTTDIIMPHKQESSLRIYADNGVLYVNSDKRRTLKMHTLTGLLMKTLDVKAGANEYPGIAKGVYIIDGQKVIIK